MDSIVDRQETYSIFDEIKLKGDKFSTYPSDNTVQFGGHPCIVFAATVHEITCKMDPNVSIPMQVLHELSFSDVAYGNGIVAISSDIERAVVFSSTVQSMSPLSGSYAGGTDLKFVGGGLDRKSLDIKVGDQKCSITQQSYSSLECTVPSHDNSEDKEETEVAITMCDTTVTDAWGQCTFKETGLNFVYKKSETLHITAAQPLEILMPNTDLTISVTGLPGNSSSASFEVSLIENSASVPCVYDSSKSDLTTNPASIVCSVAKLPAGIYSIQLKHDSFVNAEGNVQVTGKKSLSAITPSGGSIYGGLKVKIEGSGFPNNISKLSIVLGTSECQINDPYGANGEVYCMTSAHSAGNANIVVSIDNVNANFPSLSFSYDDLNSPKVTSISPQNGKAGDTLVISGSSFESGKMSVSLGEWECPLTGLTTASSVSCIVPEIQSGSFDVKVSHSDLGDSNNDVAFTSDLIVDTISSLESSFGGGIVLTIDGKGFSDDVIVEICDVKCLTSSSSYSSVQCTVPAYGSYTPGLNSFECDLKIVNGADHEYTHSSKFVYKASLTSSVSGVSPRRSGTGGGVQITISGSGFGTASNDVKVNIDGTACAVTQVSDTEIVCTTGGANRTNMDATVIVNMDGKGNAIAEEGKDAFEYIDVWSSNYSWGGNDPPEAGEKVNAIL